MNKISTTAIIALTVVLITSCGNKTSETSKEVASVSVKPVIESTATPTTTTIATPSPSVKALSVTKYFAKNEEDLFADWGKPSTSETNDYGYAHMYKKQNVDFYVDGKNEVNQVAVRSKDYDVFGIRVGMTSNEIKPVIGESLSSFQDPMSDSWVSYYINKDIAITTYADSENSPVIAILISTDVESLMNQISGSIDSMKPDSAQDISQESKKFLGKWKSMNPKRGVIEITDNRIYTEQLYNRENDKIHLFQNYKVLESNRLNINQYDAASSSPKYEMYLTYKFFLNGKMLYLQYTSPPSIEIYAKLTE